MRTALCVLWLGPVAWAAQGCSDDSSAPGSCQATVADACGNAGLYCGPQGSCVACPPGTQNCDGFGTNACECAGSCNGTICVPTTSGGCAVDTASSCGTHAFCAGAAGGQGQCVACAPRTQNCDGINANGCECSGTCDGTGCVPTTSGGCMVDTAGSCGTQAFCAGAAGGQGQCTACAAGTRNCDGINANGCECSGTCDGTGCVPVTPAGCAVDTVSSCGTQTSYCAGVSGGHGQCTACAPGTWNCDGINANGCECTSACSGTACGSVMPTSCAVDTPRSCGTQAAYCVGAAGGQGQCTSCAAGTLNCDGINTNGCECSGTCYANVCFPTLPGDYTDDQCPPTSKAVTGNSVISGYTHTRLPNVPTHCLLNDPYAQAIKIAVTADTSLQISCTAIGRQIVLSLRTQCVIDHGCSLGQDVATCGHTVSSGTYSLIVATDLATAYSCTITFVSPAAP